MSATPLPSYWPNIKDKCEPEVEASVRLLYNGINDHESALTTVASQISALQAATKSTSTSTSSSSSAGSSSSSTASVAVGGVNNQTGTSYVLMLTDNGGIVTLSNTAAVAMTLTSTVPTPFFLWVENLGAGLATLTPSTGLINGAASLTLQQNQSCFLVFSGVNWFAATSPLPAQTFAAVTHEFLTAYNAATGTFTAAQPAFTDISGTATTAQVPNLPQSQIIGLTAALAALAPLASPTFTGTVTQPAPPMLTGATTATSATAGAATALPTLPLGYLEQVVNGTTVKIAYYSV